ncbi:glucosamine-6-phosphate deaminase [Alistipes sp. An66]|uniref:glucosamine-6-phosphate deaminase n=1 Tax=Alistipes sp. An66 TaxID=1965650 RepID=UPI000B57E368|nr:glucosamine-6-phosphate deaminase [Alistipes sp. An66]OUN58669.1 glucosamine-6-phosphate deaminase [Alistipes sp. An66]
MIRKTLMAGKLPVRIYDTRRNMGEAAAADVAACIRELLAVKQEIYMIFAAAPSQNEFLAALAATPGIEWGRIHALHMDEYVGLPADAPQGFGNFLRAAIFGQVPFASVDYIGTGSDSDETCRRYAALLQGIQVDIVCMGIGENGHIAFNDPPVADFNDPLTVKKVALDETCRLQQVHDGCFARIEEVPRYAVTLTVPTMFHARYIFCIVPAPTKANAVRATVCGPVSEQCPASILRTHEHAILYTDSDSAALL